MMNQYQVSDAKLIYKAEIHFTDIVDFGVRMEDLSSGKVAIPPGGARFDQTFEGILHGPFVRGRITGTDYLYVRADGLFQLHLHGRITTEDGSRISLFSEGISRQETGEPVAQLRSAVTLFTSSEAYEWLNRLQLWAMGTFDPISVEARISAYSA